MWQGSLHQPASWSRWRGRSQGPRGKEYTEPHHRPLQTLNKAEMLLDTDTESNGHLPKGILASIGPALAGSDQPTFGLHTQNLSDKYRQIIRQISSDYQTNIVRLSDKMFCFCSPFPSRSWWQLGWLRSLGFDGDQTQELPPWEFAQTHILTFSTHLVTMSRAPLVAQ